MSLRATVHTFTGPTSPISSYDSTKTNLGTLMIQQSGLNPEDNFVGPLPTAIARPMEESTGVAMMYPHVISFSSTIDWVFLTENLATATAARRIFLYEYDRVKANYNWKGFITATLPSAANANTTRGFRALRYLHTTGTVAVAAPTSVYSTGTAALAVTGVVTGTGTTFASTHIGLMIGFGSTNPAAINCWYPIVTFTSTTSITVSGASNAIAAVAFVIASCTVTGTSTLFASDLIAAGTASTGVAGGMGPRIGFGSTDPTQITNWYHIGSIASNTSLNINTSPGVIPAGTAYVIEELRFALAVSQATAPTNGGLFLLKGAGYHDFTTAGTTFPAIASNVDNQRGVYWLADAATVTNTAPNGLCVEAETSKTSHFAYVLDGTNTTTAKFFKYNLRSNNSVAAGKMTLAGANIVITGNFSVTGTIPNQPCNNGTVATLLHGPGSGASFIYFVTLTRLYCAAVSGITAGSTTFITAANARQEIPPGGTATFPATGNMMNVQYVESIDHLIITTFATGAAYRQYLTPYPSVDTAPFDHVWGVDDRQQDQSLASALVPVHLNTGSQLLTVDASSNGMVHICRGGTAVNTNQIYAVPFGAHWTYGYTTSPANHQRVITPELSTPNCVKFDQVLVGDVHYFGVGEQKISPETYRVYYRTSNIAADATSSWVLLGDDGDLSGVTAASSIQFMIEFYTVGALCAPARITSLAVTYEDGFTDSHYQLSAGLSNATAEQFVWRFCHPFGGTVPTLKVELFDADTGSSLLNDTTAAAASGVWEKSTNGGSTWGSYNTTDKANETTYIRYTPTSLTDGIVVRALLTQN